MESSRATGPGPSTISPFGSCSSSLAFNTAQDVDDTKSESSWIALAKGKE